MAYDLEPLVTIAEKRWMLGARKESRTRGRSGGGSVPEGVLLAFPHDRQVAGARVVMRDDRPVLEERLDL
jgi:hypothetical protein